jgi:cytoskeletal protein CcmA (bactofilin family)
MSKLLARNLLRIATSVMSALFGVVACLSGPYLAWAEESSERSKWRELVVLRAGEEVQGDYFAFGPHVEISGTVHGDVYAAGGEVLMDGVVDGDLIVAGGAVTVSGEVTQDIRIAGGNVTLSGEIYRNATIAGADVHVIESAHVTGNLLAAAGNLVVGGLIDGDVRIGAGKVTLSNETGGDLVVAAAAIRLTSNASVGKDFRYWSDDDPSIDEGATILGTVTKRQIPEVVKGEEFRRGLAGMKLVAGTVSVVSTLLLGLLLLRIYPVFSRRVAATIQEQPWVTLGVGGALLAGVPLLILLCMVTVLGIPIGLVLGGMFLVTMYLGRVFVMLWAGQRLLGLMRDSPSVVWAFVTGLIAYFTVSLIPLIGGLVTLLTMVTGLGAVLITKKELVQRLREQREV